MTHGDEPQGQILVAVGDGIARLTLNNPARRNAISQDMAKLIEEFCTRVEQDETIGGVVIDARGGYFCSGADTKDLSVSSADPASSEAVDRTSAVYSAFVRVGSLPVPTVAVVAGGAVGAGLNLALAADVVLVTPDAVLDSGFLARQIHPGGGHFALLGRSLGRQQAMALGACGLAVSGERAVQLGLALEVVGSDSIVARAEALLALPAADPTLARWIKRVAALELESGTLPWAAALELERGAQMWSMRRKGEVAWNTKPGKPVAG